MSLLSPNLFNQNNHSLTEDFSLIIPENLEKITIISDMINCIYKALLTKEAKETNKTSKLEVSRSLIAKYRGKTATSDKNKLSGELIPLLYNIFCCIIITKQDLETVLNNIICDGKNDKSIDGIFFDESGRTLHIIQTKSGNSNVSDNEVDKIIKNIDEIFRQAGGKDIISKIHRNIQDSYNKFANSNQKNNILIHYAIANEIEKSNAITIIEKVRNKGLEIELYGASEIRDIAYDIFLDIPEERNITHQIDIKTPDKYAPQKVGGGIDAVHISHSTHLLNANLFSTFLVGASDICKMIEAEKNKYRTIKGLFADNLRGFLGIETHINRQIKEVISDDNNKIKRGIFPILNNGITILADDLGFDQPQAGNITLKIKNPSIVNGMQTTGSIYEIYKTDPSKISDIYVTVKIYELPSNSKDRDFVKKAIIISTNSQNIITNYDINSDSEIAKELTEIFLEQGIILQNKRIDKYSQIHQINLNSLIPNYEKPSIDLSIIFNFIQMATGSNMEVFPHCSTESKILCLNIYNIYKYMKNNSINNDSYKRMIDRCENVFGRRLLLNIDIDKGKNYLSILKTKEMNDNAIKEFLSDLYKKLAQATTRWTSAFSSQTTNK